MIPLAARILAAVLWKMGWQIALVAHKEWMRYYGEQYKALSAEQKKEWNAGAWVKDFTPGEGQLPPTQGIVIPGALDPGKNIDRPVGE